MNLVNYIRIRFAGGEYDEVLSCDIELTYDRK